MDDMISRAAAKNALLEYTDRIDKTKTFSGVIALIVRDLPAVDAVSAVHGRWISKNKEGIYGAAYCSICDFELRIDNMPYCPMCGAKMDLGG